MAQATAANPVTVEPLESRGELRYDGPMSKARNRKNLRPAEHWRREQGTMAAIRKFAREVAERFRPEKIILFGSRACGAPHADSDVDLLVIMPTRNRRATAVDIRMAIDAPFAMDLLVRTPSYVRKRLAQGDSLLSEALTRGVVLYETDDAGMGAKGRRRLPRRTESARFAPANS
jgi:predicted nucleotidyltransferase